MTPNEFIKNMQACGAEKIWLYFTQGTWHVNVERKIGFNIVKIEVYGTVLEDLLVEVTKRSDDFVTNAPLSDDL